VTSTSASKYAHWTDEHLAILREHYFDRGGPWVAQQTGHSLHAVRNKANRLRIMGQSVTMAARRLSREPELAAAEMIRDYRGLPLTIDDVRDELNLTHDQARHAVGRLREDESYRWWIGEHGVLLIAYRWGDAA